jgi:hypothetical protein
MHKFSVLGIDIIRSFIIFAGLLELLGQSGSLEERKEDGRRA